MRLALLASGGEERGQHRAHGDGIGDQARVSRARRVDLPEARFSRKAVRAAVGEIPFRWLREANGIQMVRCDYCEGKGRRLGLDASLLTHYSPTIHATLMTRITTRSSAVPVEEAVAGEAHAPDSALLGPGQSCRAIAGSLKDLRRRRSNFRLTSCVCVPSARLGRMPRESLDAPDDLPEEVLRQASDQPEASDALTTMEVGRRVWASTRSDAHGRQSCSWVGSADILSMPSSTMPMARGDVHLLSAAGRSDVEPFLLSAEE